MPKRSQNRDLTTIFQQALAQPAHIAIKRIKYAFAFETMDADMNDILEAAFKQSRCETLRANLVGRFIEGKVGFGSDDTYWRYNVLEDYIDSLEDLRAKRGELLAELNNALDTSETNYDGRDTEKIMAYFEDYSNS